ncbi:MAG: hypothetical protein D3925_13195 [Candidatus Electrothrix sp. AR5]|nr:hypothetical protein [Candidatus Electrothrix sp. AR5]
MITSVRTANMNDGKIEAGFIWAVKVAAYISKKFSVDMQAVRNVGGLMGQVHWIARFDSLADYDAVMKKISNDEGYLNFFKEVAEQRLFDAGSLADKIYETI